MICLLLVFMGFLYCITAEFDLYDIPRSQESLCSISKSPNMAGFLRDRWRSARREIGLDSSLKAEHKGFNVEQFYTFSSNILVFNVYNTIVSYVRVLKCKIFITSRYLLLISLRKVPRSTYASILKVFLWKYPTYGMRK